MNDNDFRPLDTDGLTFSCTRCSLCCRFDSGYVWLSRADLSRLADGLGTTSQQVIDLYCRVVDIGGFRQLSLREQDNNDCVFWVNGACSVYRSRPLQCSTYPFWQHQLADQEAWDRAAGDCPGIGCGRSYTRQEIARLLEKRRVEPPLNADSLGR